MTVSGSVSVNSLTFNTTAYALQGGTLSLPISGNETISVATGTTTISSVMVGNGGLHHERRRPVDALGQ